MKAMSRSPEEAPDGSESVMLPLAFAAVLVLPRHENAMARRYAPGAVSVNAVIVNAWPDANETLSTVMSPPPPVAVTVP